MLKGKVQPDGYTTNEDLKDGVDYFFRLREAGLAALEGTERDAFEMQSRWVLDRKVEQEQRSC